MSSAKRPRSSRSNSSNRGGSPHPAKKPAGANSRDSPLRAENPVVSGSPQSQSGRTPSSQAAKPKDSRSDSPARKPTPEPSSALMRISVRPTLGPFQPSSSTRRTPPPALPRSDEQRNRLPVHDPQPPGIPPGEAPDSGVGRDRDVKGFSWHSVSKQQPFNALLVHKLTAIFLLRSRSPSPERRMAWSMRHCLSPEIPHYEVCAWNGRRAPASRSKASSTRGAGLRLGAQSRARK